MVSHGNVQARKFVVCIAKSLRQFIMQNFADRGLGVNRIIRAANRYVSRNNLGRKEIGCRGILLSDEECRQLEKVLDIWIEKIHNNPDKKWIPLNPKGVEK